jgi:hypothetical protein
MYSFNIEVQETGFEMVHHSDGSPQRWFATATVRKRDKSLIINK